MTDEQAYICGLLVGGGEISETTFRIKLPLKKWGADVNNMNQIASDILSPIQAKFNSAFQCNITYERGNNGIWYIIPINDFNLPIIKQTLSSIGLPTEGILLNSADLSCAKDKLTEALSEWFITGIFDTKASVVETHRRFNSSAPIVSLEIPASTRNFKFVVQLCSWMHTQGITTDQILFNHPCFHSGKDPFYKGWKKGFKIRFLVNSYLSENSFAMRSKATSAVDLSQNQRIEEQPPCELRKKLIPNNVCVHSELNDRSLPDAVRNKLFYHYLHVCAVMNCPFAPIQEIQKMARKYRSFTSFLPLLTKGDSAQMNNLYETELHYRYFSEKRLYESDCRLSNILKNPRLRGYTKLKEGLSYLVAERLMGKRALGTIQSNLENKMDAIIRVKRTTYGYPLLLTNRENGRAVIVSSSTSNFNKELLRKYISLEELTVNVSTDA